MLHLRPPASGRASIFGRRREYTSPTEDQRRGHRPPPPPGPPRGKNRPLVPPATARPPAQPAGHRSPGEAPSAHRPRPGEAIPAPARSAGRTTPTGQPHRPGGGRSLRAARSPPTPAGALPQPQSTPPGSTGTHHRNTDPIRTPRPHGRPRRPTPIRRRPHERRSPCRQPPMPRRGDPRPGPLGRSNPSPHMTARLATGPSQRDRQRQPPTAARAPADRSHPLRNARPQTPRPGRSTGHATRPPSRDRPAQTPHCGPRPRRYRTRVPMTPTTATTPIRHGLRPRDHARQAPARVRCSPQPGANTAAAARKV